nr:hypothetical protein [uncultured Duganella sp.]
MRRTKPLAGAFFTPGTLFAHLSSDVMKLVRGNCSVKYGRVCFNDGAVQKIERR